MKKNILALCVLSLAAVGCAKQVSISTGESTKMYFDAWMQVHYPTVKANQDSLYIIKDIPGSGVQVDTAAKYVYLEYTSRKLDGTVNTTSREDLSKQIGTYNPSYYYGPHIWKLADEVLYVGIEKSLMGMKVGGSREVVIPRWLYTSDRRGTYQDYVKATKSWGEADMICEFEVVEAIPDVLAWQEDSLKRFVARNYPNTDFAKGENVDSIGFRYIRLSEPTDTTAFPSDTTIYINYTGRLLNGQVFDTTIERVAKDSGTYSSAKTYGPVSVSWAAGRSGLQLSGSSVISGFSRTLWQMRPYEKGVGIFYSEFGYSSTGSGSAIPEYSPLMFEVEIVDKP